MKYLVGLALIPALTACASVPFLNRDRASDASVSAPATTAEGQTRPRARPGAEADAGAVSAAPRTGNLGRSTASLGSPTEPGMWLKTPLVTARQPGRVVLPASGAQLEVELIPIPGAATAGSRLSLPAMQALGVPLTSLPEVEVYGG
ncbi:hypothetical protein [Pseudooceanicola aestuarii]|uniref:hypothetical protein n=1 Tax=Pseudooceanicola aestuarii TaxID=2697319 RepID=UPI001EF91645|nr:hypothetical protein [Pseudooceanicola aestuarii]